MDESGQCFDVIMLRIAMAKYGFTKKRLAKELGICYTSLLSKMNGKVHFKTKDMIKIKEIFSLTSKDFINIFFKDQTKEDSNIGSRSQSLQRLEYNL